MAAKPNPIKIESIQIDLSGYPSLMEDKSGNHFSIRGYAAEMQHKDMNSCFPVPSMDGDRSRNWLSSPLDVRDFRYPHHHLVNGNGGIMEMGLGQVHVDGTTRSTVVPLVSHRRLKHGEAGCSLSSLIGNKDVPRLNSRSNYEKGLLGSSRLMKDFRTGSSFGVLDGAGCSNSPQMMNLHNQSQNRLMKIDSKNGGSLDLNRAGWSSYTSLLLGQGMENRGIPRLAGEEEAGSNKRKRVNTMTELMMDSDIKTRDFHGNGFNLSMANQQQQTPLMDHEQVKGTDGFATDKIVELLARNLHQRRQNNIAEAARSSPAFQESKKDPINQAIIASSSNLYKNHYNIGEIAKNAAFSKFSRQQGVDSKGKSVENSKKPSLFEQYTENPWTGKRFKIDLNKEAIDPSEAIPAMQLLRLKNATVLKPGFTFGSISNTHKTGESSSTEPPPAATTIKFGPAYLNAGANETISPFTNQNEDQPRPRPRPRSKQKQTTKVIEKKATKSNRSKRPPSKSICINDLCSTNRNPAEFTIPGAKNAYMINGKDLKFEKEKEKEKGKGKGKGSRSRVTSDGRKRKKKDDGDHPDHHLR